jgi:hypothetical protein
MQASNGAVRKVLIKPSNLVTVKGLREKIPHFFYSSAFCYQHFLLVARKKTISSPKDPYPKRQCQEILCDMEGLLYK